MQSLVSDETTKEAKSQGASHYSSRLRAYYRKVPGGWEVAQVDAAGKLGKWVSDWRSYPPESAVKI